MRKLTAALCLAVALLMGGTGASWSADYQRGEKAYKSRDFATALREWTPLAKQGDADAQFYLGIMYFYGLGVTQGSRSAVKWWRLAAEQGDAKSQLKLGIMYFLGEGIPKDYVLSYMWFNIAAANGDDDASELRNDVAKDMSPTAIETAQRLARECMARDYKGC
jgi:uncharacterized protein